MAVNEPEICHRCLKPIQIGEICYGVGTTAMRVLSDGNPRIVGSLFDLIVCSECAETTESHTLEQPFAELMRSFDEPSAGDFPSPRAGARTPGSVPPSVSVHGPEAVREIYGADLGAAQLASLEKDFREALDEYPDDPDD